MDPSGKSAVSTPLRGPAITLPPSQFLYPAMQPPDEDADASSAGVDVSSSETVERADDTDDMPTITLPPPQFLFPAMEPPAMEPPEDADASSTVVDVGTSDNAECADGTDANTKK